MLLLVYVFTGGSDANTSASMMGFVGKALQFLNISANFNNIYYLLLALLFVRMLLVFFYTVTDGYLEANLRRRIQERGFASILHGDWEFLRNIRVGERVGVVTQEVTNAALYIMSTVRALYSLVTTIVLVTMAMIVSLQVTLLLAVVGIPTILLLKYLFGLQGRIAEKLVGERQGFYADVTERIHGLFQIKVEADVNRHVSKGLKHQDRLTWLELRWWYARAFIYGFNALLPIIVLILFYAWALWRGQPLKDLLFLMAGVGIIGVRAMSQINQLNAQIGTVTGYSGSIAPVYNLFTMPKAPDKKPISEKIQKVELRKVSYSYGENAGIEGVTQDARIGRWLAIMGPSGSGKTTMANLIAGIYKPQEGEVLYYGASGTVYNAIKFRPKVGYVTQDILLFHGTIRENLVPSETIVSDEFLWDCLQKTGADGFIRHLGGLDAIIAESGRSLSGGERRRLGIARMLTSSPDILILDEVTVGLDEARKKEIIKIIHDLSRSLVVIVITHDIDVIQLESDNIFSFNA